VNVDIPVIASRGAAQPSDGTAGPDGGLDCFVGLRPPRNDDIQTGASSTAG
jgi:hypothetical protein